MKDRIYLCIDLKSFYASVECVERDLDPMTTNLVVADPERTDKTICLAVSPSMKALGVKNRCRVFEIPKNIEYIMAEPRMQKYIEYAAEIYSIYLDYLAKEDIYVYSIDEVFMDITGYLKKYGVTPRQMAQMLMNEITNRVGVRATCGIGTNLYLAKVALDIMAKHADDFIGFLDEELYREKLWEHEPITDFWRIGSGTAKRLSRYGITNMREIAETDEDLLYSVFGIDAELIIDHAWGREPVTLKDIKAYKPKSNCLVSGQVLMRDYTFDEAKVIVKEMMDSLCLELVEKELVTGSVTLYIGYSNELKREASKGTFSIAQPTSADSVLIPEITRLFEKIADRHSDIRRISISCNRVTAADGFEQLTFFEEESTALKKTNTVQKAVIDIKKKYGKNAILKGMNFEEGATARDRNRQIGGHKSGE